jgi:hypothetical protein
MITLSAQTRKYPPILFGVVSEDKVRSPKEKGILAKMSRTSLRMSDNDPAGFEDVMFSNSAASRFSNSF